MLLPNKMFVWVDLETTGSTLGRDDILEVAVVLTTTSPELKEVDARSYLTKPLNPNWYNDMSAFVTKMHSDNGLLTDLKEDGGIDLRALDEILVQVLSSWGVKDKHDAMLAGSGVGHFDRPFIRRYLPRFDAMLSYPVLDVGSIRRALKIAGKEYVIDAGADNRSHRAMDDIRHHIEEMRTYLKVFNGFSGVHSETSGKG